MMHPMQQYQLDNNHRNETLRQAEQDRLAALANGKNLLTATRTHLSHLLTSTGQKLQQRYAAEEQVIVTTTGTFQAVELS